MAEIRVRNIDDGVVELLRARAAREGLSLAGSVRQVLEAEALRPRQEMVARVRAWHDEMVRRHGLLPDSTPEIRAERNQRG
jgi:plasmid stability protein